MQVLQDGNVAPIFCPDGHPNLAADAWFRRMAREVTVMNAGADASLDEVQAAMCLDKTVAHMTNPMEFGAYELRSTEVGWTFGDVPENWLLTARC